MKNPRHCVDRIPLAYFKPNSTHLWEGLDSQETFDRNMQDRHLRNILINHGYVTNPVVYDIDSLGFRNPNGMDISNSVLALGCSHTFGTGQHKESTWPHLLSLTLNQPVYNAGMPGASSDHNYRVASAFIPRYQPTAVFHLMPPASRFEVINDRCFYQVTQHNEHTVLDGISYKAYLRHKMNHITMALQQDRNMLAIKRLCQRDNIPYVCIFSNELAFDIPDHEFDENTEWARDLGHFGLGHNKETTKQMYNRYLKATDES